MQSTSIQDVRILVVDDQAGPLEVIVTALRAFGFREVHRVTSGEDGIAHLKANRVDLIIVDLAFGSSKHLTLARDLGESADPALKELPMIMLTRPANGTGDSDVDLGGISDMAGATVAPDFLLESVANAVGMAGGQRKKKRILH